MSSDLLSLVLMYTLAHLTTSCLPPAMEEFPQLTMEEVLQAADIVVYGREREHVSGVTPETRDGIFQVYCVLKNTPDGEAINETIRILWVYPLHSCQNTFYDNTTDVMLTLRRSGEHYQWHAVATMVSSAYTATDEALRRAMGVCELHHAVLPGGREADDMPTCPIDLIPQDTSCRDDDYTTSAGTTPPDGMPSSALPVASMSHWLSLAAAVLVMQC